METHYQSPIPVVTHLVVNLLREGLLWSLLPPEDTPEHLIRLGLHISGISG